MILCLYIVLLIFTWGNFEWPGPVCLMQRGLLKSVKALGWYLEEQDLAQVSINLCDYTVTSIHAAYEECCRIAKVRARSGRVKRCQILTEYCKCRREANLFPLLPLRVGWYP